jgi:hypothetical protein
VDAAADTLVRRVVHDHADVTLAELCARVAAAGVRVSVATMGRVLQCLGWPAIL